MDQLADDAGFMRYQIRTFNQHSVMFVNMEALPLSPDFLIGFSEDDGFTPGEVKVISAAIRDEHSNRKA
jgi:hypothetical protein